MAISRMQQPRQLYGLGSLVKSIGKGVKNLIKSPVGKGLLLAGGFGLAGMGPFAGLSKTPLGTKLFGMVGPGSGGAKQGGLFSSLIDKFSSAGTGTKLGVGGGLVSLLLADGFSGDEVKAITQDKVAVSKYLRDYYTKLNPDAKEPEIQEFIETNTSEYATGGRVGFNKGSGEVSGTFGVLSENADISKIIDQKVRDYENEYMKKTGELPPEFYGDKYRMQLQNEYLMNKKADGGRIGLKDGLSPALKQRMLELLKQGVPLDKLQEEAESQLLQDQFLEMRTGTGPGPLLEAKDGGRIGLKDSVKFMTEKELEETMPGLARGEVKNYELKKKANRMEKLMELLKEYEKNKKAAGGMPTGIMRTNQAGVLERDYRDEGGFVPVGIKERADDVPAMLSKNEFVMTADAVRGAGDGSIEKGAQKMYDQMKRLENKVA